MEHEENPKPTLLKYWQVFLRFQSVAKPSLTCLTRLDYNNSLRSQRTLRLKKY